jgi:hypothetical protein
MKTPLEPGELFVKSGPANMQRGWETVGGWLYLTSSRLVFESHVFNINTGATVIPLDTIADVSRSWTKFLDLIPLVPNAIVVLVNDKQEHRFTLWGRSAWAQAIVTQLRSAGAGPSS